MSRLGDIFNLVGGGTPTTSIEEYWGNGTPWISSADIDQSGRIVYRRRVTPSGVANSTTNVVPGGTVIVVTRVGLGKVAQLTEDTCFSQDIQALLARETAPAYNSRFLMYQLLFKMQTVKYSGRGTTISGITKKQLADVSLYFPPLPEQEHIVARIEELFSQLDAGEETLRKTKAQLAVYRQAVLKEALYAGDMFRIRECIEEMGQGWSPKCERVSTTSDDEWAVITTTAIQPMGFHFEENKRLPDSLLPREKHVIEVGDLLITRAGPRSRCGICCLVRETKKRLLNCDKVYRMRVKKDFILPEYLELILNSPAFIKEIAFCKTGGNDSGVNLTQDRFLDIEVPVPSIDVQMNTISEIESRLSICDSIEQTVAAALQQAEAMRQSVLKDAFEGRL